MSSSKGKLGFRVLAAPPRLSAALVDRFRGMAAANLADNAASLAGAEHNPVALALAIETYEGLLARAECIRNEEQFVRALEHIDEALAIARRCTMPLHQIDGQLARAAVLARTGRPADAAETAGSAAAVAKRLGYRRRDAEFVELCRRDTKLAP